MDSDFENDNNWGNKKSEYYERNKLDRKDENYHDEEEEAIKIQQAKLKKYKELNLFQSDDEDQQSETKGKNKSNVEKFNLDSSESEEEEKIEINKKVGTKKTKNTKISKTTKINSKPTPSLTPEEEQEHLQIIKNIKINLDEIEENISPIIEILSTETTDLNLKLNQTKQYLLNKKNTHLLYTIYMLYYIYYKNQGKISDHHPVVKKMFYLREIMKKMKSLDENIFGHIDKFLKSVEENKNLQNYSEDQEDQEEEENDEMDNEFDEIENLEVEESISEEKLNKLSHKSKKQESDDKFLSKKRTQEFIQENSERMKKLIESKEKKQIKDKALLKKEIEYKNQMGQRLANDKVLKSKGLYRKRKQYQGNAKLHLREKFHKKEMQRKNYIKAYEGKPEVYGGEITGIRRDLVRSTKLK